MDKTTARNLAISLLDDENGITEESFNLLQVACECHCGDIFRAVKSAEGRVFLPEEHGLLP